MRRVIPDAVSVDSIKRRFFPSSPSLLSYFTTTYGRPGSRSFDAARNNFVESLAGYSLLCYLLQIRVRNRAHVCRACRTCRALTSGACGVS
jgi:phosphatidylinositol 4-kinase